MLFNSVSMVRHRRHFATAPVVWSYDQALISRITFQAVSYTHLDVYKRQLLSGAAISVAGLISFVGLVVPHIARLLVGSDYKYLFPASTLLGFTLVTVCDTVGRVIMPPGEIPVSIILAFIGAPFFLYLLRTRQKE